MQIYLVIKEGGWTNGSTKTGKHLLLVSAASLAAAAEVMSRKHNIEFTVQVYFVLHQSIIYFNHAISSKCSSQTSQRKYEEYEVLLVHCSVNTPLSTSGTAALQHCSVGPRTGFGQSAAVASCVCSLHAA